MLQKIIDIFYRYPKSTLLKYKRFGGFIAFQDMKAEERSMRSAALKIGRMHSYIDGLPVYFLTGKDHFHQTLFCIKSLIENSSLKFHFYLVDDGTFTTGLIERIKEQLPDATIIDKSQIATNLNRLLPKKQFPRIHQKREVYPHIKKLTDVHTTNGGKWKLVLDSDMLFMKEPSELIKWLKAPENPLYMLDCAESYGYSHQLIESICSAKVPKLINVGVIGLNSESLIWQDIEIWIQKLEEAGGSSYYLEQAISAMIIGESAATILPESEYIVNPNELAVQLKKGKLQHYVDLSKAYYYKQAWKRYDRK